MTILYFINTFMLCHLGEPFIKIEEFLMVEDGTYELYPWGKIAFDKLITSLRQDFNQSKQMYRLFGMTYALNVLTYECASSINPEIVVKVANGIPRICNWTVVAVKPKYEKFMSSIFSENACSNIVPTQDEVEALDLPDIQDAHTPDPSTTAVLPNKVQTRASTSGFEDFSTSPPGHLLRKSSRVSGTSSPPPPKRRKKIDTPKTKVSEPELSEQLRPPLNQSFSMPDEAPTPHANVSFAHVSSQVQKDKSVYPDIEELKQHMKEYVDSKFEYLVNLIKANHSEMMNSRNREDDKQPKDLGSKSTPCIVEVSGKEGNDGHQTSTCKFDQQPTSPIQMDFSINDQDIGVSDFDVKDQTEDTLKNHQEMKEVSELQSSDANVHHTAETTEHKKDDPTTQIPQQFFEGTMNEDSSYKVQRNTNQSVSDTATFYTLDSTTSGTISSETREVMHTLIVDLGRLPIPVKPSQLPTDIPITEIVVRSDTNTPLARIRMPSKICKSPYLTSFGSSEKGKEVMEDFIEWVTIGLLKTHAKKKPTEDKYRAKASSLGFEMMDYVVAYPSNKNWFYAISQPKNCWTDQHIDVVFYYLRKKSKLRSMNQYRYITVNCLFSSHINNTHESYYNNVVDDDISTQEHIDCAVAVSVHERSITNVMKGFSIPAALPWHLVDDVYIPVNCDGKFHWVLAVVELNRRLIRVYNSSIGTRKQVHYEEIKKLSKMLPSYLLDSDVFEKNERTMWLELDANKDKQTGTLLESHIPFNIEYVQGIMQQEDDRMDCGLYIAIFAEFLSDQLVIPPDIDGHLANYLRNRYAALLWRYDNDKFKGGYISENDDPPKPKGQFTTPTEQDFVNID
ncbi:hypothetical protein KY284_022284 [Solanum tuberosum]|nr:hypothetical protein KY284_022284 [Solanum tuberosum]